jgi:phage/plasmid-like protein (TIGR03299 family)
MSAEVDTMAHAHGSKLPWHGESTEASENARFDVDLFGKEAGIIWRVNKIPLVTVPQAQKTINYAFGLTSGEECPQIEGDVDNFAVCREDSGKVLGVVGPRYNPLQNASALDWFRPWTENKLLGLNTAGALFGGKKIWVLADFVDDPLIQIVPGDDIKKFILLSNSHDGTTSLRVGLTPIRVVCNNTMMMAYHSAESKLVRLRHSSQIQQNLENMREIIDIANQDFAATAEQFKLLAQKDINQSDLRKYVRILVQGDKDALKPWDDVPTRSQNIVKEIESNMDSSLNTGTANWWKAMNAFNEYLNHTQGRNVSNRLNSLWYGVNEATNRKALTLALELAA